MSGVYGVIQFEKGRDADEQYMKKMQMWNRAYGKDNEEIYVEENWAIGCCYEKLSLHMPQSSPVLKRINIYAVIDACLYNKAEIMELCEIKQDISDEELLLEYIEKYGYNALEKVNGDFCGAIYNDKNNSVTLFRDHMGIRPLYYYYEKKKIIFSTDLRGIISHPSVNVSINKDWLYRCVHGAGYIDIEGTEIEQIFCVKPATYVSFSFENDEMKIKNNYYWKLGRKKVRFLSQKKYCDTLKELITDAVKRRLEIAPGLVGAELSGGLDSSVIDILINRLGREGVYYSWSLDPAEHPLAERDERRTIIDVCKQEKIVCNYKNSAGVLDLNSNIVQSMKEIGLKLNPDEPFIFQCALPPYTNTIQLCLSAQLMKQKGARVIFSGHGGDEGVSHRANVYELYYYGEYVHFLKHIWKETQGKKFRMLRTIKRSFCILQESKKRFFGVELEKAGSNLLLPEFEKMCGKKIPSHSFAYDPISHINNGGVRNRLDNVALYGAYNGVRYMMPYLDYRVIDYAVSIPRHMYLKNGKNRYVFREAFKDIMPSSLYSLMIKDNSSWDSLQKSESSENRMERFQKNKEEMVTRLDKGLWGQYLDYTFVERWLKTKPTNENIVEQLSVNGKLLQCALLQNTIAKAREI